jgi:hypothetical protein
MSKTSVISTTITSGESSQKAIGNKTRLVLGRGRGLFREALISIGTSSAGHETLGIYQRSRQSRSTRTTHTCCRRISGVDATADGSGVKQPINGDHALKGWYRPFADAAGRDDTAVSVMLLSRFPLPSVVRTRHASHTTCSWVEICDEEKACLTIPRHISQGICCHLGLRSQRMFYSGLCNESAFQPISVSR